VSDIEPEDFLVRVRPTFSKGGEWTGSAEVSLIVGEDSKLDDETKQGMEAFILLMLSSLPAMDIDEYVREKIYSIATSAYPNLSFDDNDFSDDDDSVLVIRGDNEDDNIIHLLFSKDVKGNA